jgi:hypothetical protein
MIRTVPLPRPYLNIKVPLTSWADIVSDWLILFQTQVLIRTLVDGRIVHLCRHSHVNELHCVPLTATGCQNQNCHASLRLSVLTYAVQPIKCLS